MPETETVPPLRLLPPPAPEDSILGGAALNFAAKVGGAAFTAGLVLFLTRALGAAGYGVFALGLSIIALVDLPSDFGVAVAIPRFLAEHRDKPRMLIELMADAIRLELLGTLLFAAGVAVLAGPIASAYHAPELAWPLRVLAVALIGQNLLFFASGVFSAMRRQALMLRASLTEGAAELTASVALVLALGGTTAAAAGRAIGYAVGGGLALVLALRAVGGGFPRSARTAGHARRITSFAITLVIVDSAFTVFAVIDSLLIGAYIGTRAVGIFSAPARLITLLQYPGYAIAAAVSPRLLRTEGAPPNVGAFREAARALTILGVGVSALTTVWAGPLIHLALGSQFAGSAAVLRALGPYVFLCGHGALVSTAMNYLGAARQRIPIAFGTVALNAVIDVVLIPRIGVLGGAVGTDVGYTLYTVAQLAICLRVLGLPGLPMLTTLARSLVAALPASALLFALGTGRVALPALLAGGVAGVILYAAMLVLVGEVSRPELDRGLRLLRGRLRGGAG